MNNKRIPTWAWVLLCSGVGAIVALVWDPTPEGFLVLTIGGVVIGAAARRPSRALGRAIGAAVRALQQLKLQERIALGYAAVVALLILYPPWIGGPASYARFLGHRAIWAVPHSGLERIDVSVLILELIALTLICGVILWVVRQHSARP